MSDTATTSETVKTVASEIGKAAAKATVQTAVEMAAAVALLAAAGFALQLRDNRRAKKSAAKKAEIVPNN